MQISFKSPKIMRWATSHAYQRQVKNRTTLCVADYASNYRVYDREVKRVAQLAQQHLPRIETAMLCGIGGSHEEVSLILDNFPSVKEMHLVDWHKPNLDYLANYFVANQILGREVDLTLHYADLRRPETIDLESVDFAFADKVFDLYDRRPIETQSVLWGIATRLRHGGMLFSFDYPLDREVEGRDFYELAETCGLSMITDRVLKKTL